MKVPDGLAEVEILDDQGRSHQLGELWQQRTVLLLFVRHFG